MSTSIKVNLRKRKILFKPIDLVQARPDSDQRSTRSSGPRYTTRQSNPKSRMGKGTRRHGSQPQAGTKQMMSSTGSREDHQIDILLITDPAADASLSMDQSGITIPELFTSLPPLRDQLETETSCLRDETIQECLPLLSAINDSSGNIFDFNSYGLPKLEREKHVQYLHNCLNPLPARFVSYDASRPWIVYWVLLGLRLLGEDVQQYRNR